MFFEAERSKEAIKSRMLKVALNHWQLTDGNDLDPLVKILMDALSAELYDVVNDIKTAEGRILEKMAHLLAPDLLTTPLPAHAVMQALPGEPTDILDQSSQFVTTKKIAARPDGPLETPVDLYFAPINKVRIFNADITYLYTSGNLYSFDKTGNKLLLAVGNDESLRTENFIYVGINSAGPFTDLQGMTFFFDVKNIETSTANSLYQYLPNTSWFIADKKIDMGPGIFDYKVKSNSTVEDQLKHENIMSSIVDNISAYYRPRFLTVTDELNISEEQYQQYPKEFTTVFPAASLTGFQQKMLWLKIVFPVAIKEDLLNALHVKINTFPVVNCRKNDMRYRLRGGRHIIPIPNVPNENFLAIRSFNDADMDYRSEAVKKSSDKEIGTYTLRTGGLERFDSRNGREMILYLVELLRSESAAFSVYGQDFIAGTLKEINQFIALLEQRINLKISEALETPNYIIVSPAKGKDLMFVEYWTTNAELANNIRQGTKLHQLSGAAVRSDSLLLLTSTLGGKEKLQTSEKLAAFKYGLLTHDRLVTVEDIRSFCFHELGSRLSNVAVQRGFVVSDNMKEGIKRTIDVIMTPQKRTTKVKIGKRSVII
jgi:hypothetical protein